MANQMRMIRDESFPDPPSQRAKCTDCEYQNYCRDIWRFRKPPGFLRRKKVCEKKLSPVRYFSTIFYALDIVLPLVPMKRELKVCRVDSGDRLGQGG
jgi:hypothetical protein